MTLAAILSNLFAWSLQALAVILVGGGLPRLFRLEAPDIRHGYWRALLLACVLLPVVQPWRAAATTDRGAPLLSGAVPGAAVPGRRPGVTPQPSGSPIAASLGQPAIAALLVAGAGARLAWLCVGLVRLRRLRRAGRWPNDDERDDEIRALEDAGAEVRYVPSLAQPVTFGFARPIVLLPPSLREQPVAVQRAVCIHELWHVRRHDWPWVVLEECVRAVLWFHPAISWLVSRVQSSREEVVDELAVLTTNARRSYLEALLVFADQPRIYPATPFARRRHLFQRMLLISREAVMSSRRIVASCAAMGAVVVIGGWCGVAAFPLRSAPLPAADQAPRDLRPGEARPASAREIELRTVVTAKPALNGYLELVRLQQERGAMKEAEATLTEARAALPAERTILMAMASFYARSGRFDQAVAATDDASAMAPNDPTGPYAVATFYEQKVRGDSSLAPADRLKYIQAGIAASDRALALNADYAEAMIIKNILMRYQANTETNPAVQAQLIAEADLLRTRVIELQRSRVLLNGHGQPAAVNVGTNGRMPPPPPPPPPPGAPASQVDGLTPVRVGGGIQAPTKIKNVPPVYPPVALEARVSGVVIIEATIDPTGAVSDARILRSIPLLDQAAIEAVNQWQFTPTLLNSVPVPVIMTMTVNFTLQ